MEPTDESPIEPPADEPVRPAEPAEAHKAGLVVTVVAAGLGILLILLGDFGGWYTAPANWDAISGTYAFPSSAGTVGMFNDVRAFLALLVAIAGLTVAGLAGMARLGWVPITPRRLDRVGFAGGIAAAAVAVVGAIIFFALAWEADEVWLDTAFFGAVGAGALTAGLLWAAGALKEDEPTR